MRAATVFPSLSWRCVGPDPYAVCRQAVLCSTCDPDQSHHGTETTRARHRLHSVLNRLAFDPALMLLSPCSATGTAPGAAPRGSRAAAAREGRRHGHICPCPWSQSSGSHANRPPFAHHTSHCVGLFNHCGAVCLMCVLHPPRGGCGEPSEGSHCPCPFLPCSFTPVPSSTSNPSALRVCSAFNLLPAAPGHAVPVLHPAVH